MWTAGSTNSVVPPGEVAGRADEQSAWLMDLTEQSDRMVIDAGVISVFDVLAFGRLTTTVSGHGEWQA
ncbi:MAG: hypothetical protein QOF00_3229 [Pseudonocardiales bacterium]|jgi:hypothetical protein|nr:hypothetical protein [Pseudonocardiales bacterium]